MERIVNLKDLLIEQLRELYNAEKQQQEALNELVGKVSEQDLRMAVQAHIDETTNHIARIELECTKMGFSPLGEYSEAMRGIVKECYEQAKRSSDPQIMDAGIIAGIQYMKHFEIAGYGTACAYARELGLDDIAERLHITLEEEKRFDIVLTDLAGRINKKALSPVIA